MTKDTLGFSASDREPGSLSPVPPQRKHKGIRIEKSCVSAASCRSGLGVQVASGSGGSVDNDVFYDADDSDVGGSGGQAAETSASSSDDSLSDEIVLVCGHPADADVADIAADDIVLLRGHPVGNGAKRVSADTVVVDERPTTRGLTFDEISAQTAEMRQLSSTNTGSARGRSHSNSSAGSFRSTSNGVHSFGQRPPRLLDCLKDILKRYPEGGQILKELIQNAEDAGAREVKFLYDKNSYPTRKLVHPGLADFQGPALYAYNDALFRPEDWDSIQSVQRSSKADNPMKVGRFGIGFNSIYHITDLPSILSGEFVGIFDPHEMFFGDRETGNRWHLYDPEIAELSDQFQPYSGVFADCSGGVDTGYYDGTLFRFPLRRSSSELASATCTEKNVRYLFDSFIVDAEIVLLFLKSLESVDIYERERGSQRAKLLYRVRIAEDCVDDVRDKRRQFVGSMQNNPHQRVMMTHVVTVETCDYSGATARTTTRSWMINHYRPGRDDVSRDVGDLSLQLRNIPWVSTAVPLDGATSHVGRVSCFLPLPPPSTDDTPTRLPVNVNAYFGLTDSRRDIKWLDAEQRNDASAKWNDGLLREVLPGSYVELVLDAISSNMLDVEKIMSLLPDIRVVDGKWRPMADVVLRQLFAHPIFHCDANGGSWLRLRDVVLDSDDSVADYIRRSARSVLLDVGYPVVLLPSAVQTTVQEVCPFYNSVRKMTPGLVREAVRRCHDDDIGRYSREDQLAFLKYCLSDENYGDLRGLLLLPLEGESLTRFVTSGGATAEVFVVDDNEYDGLFPGLEEIMLDRSLSQDLVNELIRTEGTTQLKLVTPDLVPLLVQMTLERMPELSAAWMKRLWSYLLRNLPEDLSLFHDMSILPDASCLETFSLSLPSAVILRQMHSDTIPPEVAEGLQELGMCVVDVPTFALAHPQITKYVNLPTPVGVLTALATRLYDDDCLDEAQEAVAELEPRVKRALRKFFSGASSLDDSATNILRALPIFEANARGADEPTFVSARDVTCSTPQTMLPVTIPDTLIDINCDRHSFDLAEQLGVEECSLVDVLLESVLPAVAEGSFYDAENVDKLADWMSRNFNDVLRDSESVISALSDLSFVTSGEGGGERVRPGELYDPTCEKLKKLFAMENRFPVGIYARADVVAMLKCLGLLSYEQVTINHVIDAARAVSSHDGTGEGLQPTREKAHAILQWLEENVEQIDGTDAASNFADIRFVSCERAPTLIYPKQLHFETVDFALPYEIVSDEYVHLIGSVVPTVAATNYPMTAKLFGWTESPALPSVLEHFRNVVEAFHSAEKGHFEAVVYSIYKYLSDSDDSDVVQSVTSAATPWVWHGDGFTTADRALTSVSSSLDLHPYAYVTPPMCTEFEPFFVRCGIDERPSQERLVNILHEIRDKWAHCQTIHPFDEYAKDKFMVLQILEYVKSDNENDNDELPYDVRTRLLLPVATTNGRLEFALVNECTYCEPEEQWLYEQYMEIEGGTQKLKFVHPEVPKSTIELLGVPSLSKQWVEADDVIGFEQAGQQEPLTRRIHRLLQEYSDGLSIPKEIIQNADDAGATVVKFLYDRRQHSESQTQLLDKAMVKCQGPALFAYNDGVFTDEDFVNITKLSGATKKEKTEKIGHFGLGFNSIYNITDVPSIVSRNYVLILDPTTAHLGRQIRDKSKPGIKINTRKRYLDIFDNQFKPYHGVFGCCLSGETGFKEFDGTLIRLPLRTTSSEIYDKCYTDNDMVDLLSILAKEANTLLLFTQSVKKVEVYIQDDSDVLSPVKLLSISKAAQSYVRELRAPLNLANCDRFTQQTSILRASAFKLKEIKEIDEDPQSVMMDSSIVIQMGCRVTKEGRDFFRDQAASTNSVSWLICSVMGGKDALALAKTNRSLVPCASVAVPVEKVDKDEDYFIPHSVSSPECSSQTTGAVFCYLPLPIVAGLPVHVNGSFAITPSRRHLIERVKSDKPDVRVDWNEAMMETLTLAYLRMLSDVKKLLPPTFTSYHYHHLFPLPTHGIWKILGTCFYKHLATSPKACLFSDEHGWAALTRCVFLDTDIRCAPGIGDTALAVLRLLANNMGKLVIDMPPEIFQEFLAAGCREELHGSMYTQVEFFTELFLPALGDIPAALRDPLVVFALDSGCEEIQRSLSECNCIPASPGGESLKRPSELFHPEGAASLLFTGNDGRFPFGTKDTYCSPQRLETLCQLGMAKDHLSSEDILDRALSVARIPHHADSLRQCRLLLSHLENNPDMLDSVDLRHIPFIPVLARPSDHPVELPWGGDTISERFLAPDQLWVASTKNVIGVVNAIVDDKTVPVSNTITEKLSFRSAPIIEDVAEQMRIICRANLDLKDKKLATFIQAAFREAYTHLQHVVEKDSEALENAKEILQGQPCILVGTNLLGVEQVTFEWSTTLPPYLFELPLELRTLYKDVFEHLGVKQRFDYRDYMTVLQQIRKDYSSKRLGGEISDVVVTLIRLLATEMKAAQLTTEDVEKECGSIILLDNHGVMQLRSLLCFNDCPWVPDDSSFLYVSTKIDYHTASVFGVRTKKRENVLRIAEGFKLPFGQREKLTGRIKRILTGYNEEDEILKEMLQNADDAGATEIAFINDSRQLKGDHLLDDNWKMIQGPSLCVYNNAPFRPSDIVGIQNLGEGSKATDSYKMGRYGVGFNVVYKVTDLPTFLTKGDEIGECLCALDPHASYLSGTTPDTTGVMLRVSSSVRDTYSDMFDCYISDEFHMQNATMFRLPLRNRKMAETSKISSSEVSNKDISQMFEIFKQQMLDILLFTNNVKTVKLVQIPMAEGDIEEYIVTTSLSKYDEISKLSFIQHVRDISLSLREGNLKLEDIDKRTVSYVVHVSDNKGVNETWTVNQQIGFEPGTTIPEAVTSAFASKELAMLPLAGTAAQLPTNVAPSAANHEKRKCKVFCYLPLPGSSELDVHVNGQFILDHEARRRLEDGGGFRRAWNMALIEHVAAPCYLALINAIKDELNKILAREYKCNHARSDGGRELVIDRLKAYSSVFPPPGLPADTFWRALSCSVYTAANANNASIIPVALTQQQQYRVDWYPPSEVNFRATTTEELRVDNNKLDVLASSSRLDEILLDIGFRIAACPNSIRQAFAEADEIVSHVTPTTVISYLRGAMESLPLPCHITKTKFKSVDRLEALIDFCKDADDFFEELAGLPLLLRNDHTLQRFSTDAPVYLTEFADLLPDEQHAFLHNSLASRFKPAMAVADPKAVFRRFTPADLASRLEGVLDSGTFLEQKYVQTSNELSPWLRRLWTFLRECAHEDEAGNTDELFRPIEKWCLLPVKVATSAGMTESYLVQISHANLILDLSVETSPADISQKMKTALTALAVPELDVGLIYEEEDAEMVTAERDIPQALCANLMKAESILQAISKASKDDRLVMRSATAEMCGDILMYFSQNIAALEDVEDSDEVLRALPLHVTIGNKLVSIAETDAFLISSQSKLLQMDQRWMDYCDVTFLVKQSHKLIDLYNFLDCPEMEPTELYLNHILTHFHRFSPDAMAQHMEYVRDRVWKDCMMSAGQRGFLLQESLKKLHFLPGADGKLHTASYFYDPKQKTFEMLLDAERFPPSPYNSDEWLPLLRNVGLKNSLTCDLFLEFARKIASEAATATPSEETREKSVTLVNYLFGKMLVSHDYSSDDLLGLLSAIKDLKFLAPETMSGELLDLSPPYGQQETECYVRFNGSVCPGYTKLAWAVSTLLPPYADPTKHYTSRLDGQSIVNALGVKSVPGNSTVVNNVTAVVGHVMNFREEVVADAELKRRVDCVTDHFRFLKEHAPLDKETQMKLGWTKCVPVEMGRTFVEPYKIVIELAVEDEIPPFLYKIPLSMGPFSDLLSQLGAAHTVTVAQYGKVLHNLYEETKFSDSKLHPNECVLAFRAIKKLLTSLKDSGAGTELKRSTVYLPSKSLRMYKSTDLIFNDKPSFKAVTLNKEYVISLKECGIDGSDYDYWKLLPDEVRPKMLSDLVEERMLTDVDEAIECCSLHHSVRRMLTSQSFQWALLRLIAHERHLRGAAPDEGALEADIVGCLATLTLHCVDELRVGLTYKTSSLQIPETAVDIPCFVRKDAADDDGGSLTMIYVNHGKELKGMVEKTIATFLCDHFVELDRRKDVLHVLLSNEDSHMLILDQYNIKKDEQDEGADEEAATLPKPGDFIPVSDQHLLQQSLDRRSCFRPGEYVGYEVDCEEQSATYLYAVIVDAMRTRGDDDQSAITKKYRIDVGQRTPVVAMATDIYKFIRPEKTSSSDELVVYESQLEGDAAEAQRVDDHATKRQKTVEQMKREVTQTLEETWRLPDAERKKVQRRLYLSWHPDKNPDDVATATTVFKHLQDEIQRIEKRKEKLSTKTWDSWAKRHSEQRQRYQENMRENYEEEEEAAGEDATDGGAEKGAARKKRPRRQKRQKAAAKESEFVPPPTFEKKNPQPGEAKRWYRQAAEDLRAAYHDLNSHPPSSMWACFKAHQSAEKAIRAAQLWEDAIQIDSHDLTDISRELDHKELKARARHLQSILGDAERMLYPGKLQYPQIPSERYPHDKAVRVVELAEKIIGYVEAVIEV